MGTIDVWAIDHFTVVPSCLGLEWKWGWRWPLLIETWLLFLCKFLLISITKVGRFLSKQGQLQPHFHFKGHVTTQATVKCSIPALSYVVWNFWIFLEMDWWSLFAAWKIKPLKRSKDKTVLKEEMIKLQTWKNEERSKLPRTLRIFLYCRQWNTKFFHGVVESNYSQCTLIVKNFILASVGNTFHLFFFMLNLYSRQN